MFLARLALITVADLHCVLLETRTFLPILSPTFVPSASTKTLAFSWIGTNSTYVGVVILFGNVLIFFHHIDVVAFQIDATRFPTPWRVIACIDSVDPAVLLKAPCNLVGFLPRLRSSRLWKSGFVLFIVWIHTSISANLISSMGSYTRKILQQQLLLAFLNLHLFEVSKLSFPAKSPRSEVFVLCSPDAPVFLHNSSQFLILVLDKLQLVSLELPV